MNGRAPPQRAADALWRWPGAPVEPPNLGRGGHSEVLRIALPGGAAYLKRQRGHTARTWRAPLRGEATLAREARMLRRAARAGVGTPPVLYFHTAGAAQHAAVLLTAALDGFAPPAARTARAVRHAQLRAAGQAIARLHRAWLQHGALYPKHVLLAPAGAGFDVRLLDFEKARLRPPALAARRDLDSLNRHAVGWSRADRLRFLLAYCGQARLSRRGRRLWRHLARRAEGRVPLRP